MKEIKQYINELTDQGYFEAIGDAVSIQGTDYKVLYQNNVLKDLIGDHIGEYCYQAYEKRESICEGCPVAKSFKDGKIHKAERTAPTDKETLYVDISASPLMDSTGKIIAVIEIVRDITDRKKNEDVLFESEEKYRFFIDNASFGISTYDESGQCVVANKVLADMIGATVEQVLSQNFLEIKSWQRSGMLDTAKEALESGEKKRRLFHVVTTFGKKLWLDCTFIPYHEKGIKHLMFLTEDVTSSKQTEEKLRQSEEKYRKHLEQMVDVRTAELEDQKRAVEQKNIALGEVIGEIELQKSKIKDDFLTNINELVMPTLKEIKAKGGLDDKYIDLMMQNLQTITSSFGSDITSRNLKLTPREIEVCNMVEKGFTNKDIANLLSLTVKSIEEYRKHIRKKLGLTNKKVNLTSYLRNLESNRKKPSI